MKTKVYISLCFGKHVELEVPDDALEIDIKYKAFKEANNDVTTLTQKGYDLIEADVVED